LEFQDSRIKWVDTKITFEKKLLDSFEDPGLGSYQGELTKELEELAYLSGTYSRFKLDSRLQNGEFEKLYKLWINKALESQKVLVTPEKAGMVSFSVEKEIGRIGLIAVSDKYQGQGWGKKLVQAIEFWAFQKGAKAMQIVTQESNIPACRLFQNLGYEIVEKVFVYHWWKGLSTK